MADEETSLTHVKHHLNHLGERVDDLHEAVKEHVAMDKQYYKEIDKLVTSEEENESMDNSALVAALMSKQGGGAEAGALGGGLGLVGGVLLGSLLNRNGGLFGGEGAGAGAVGLQNAIDTSTITEMVGDVKASVPLAEAQVQLALAGAVGEIRTHLGQVENGVLVGQGAINKNISEAIASSLASQNAINVNVLQTSTANLMATKDAQYATLAAITADGEKTRALITENTIAQLNRLAAERQDEIIELRNAASRDRDRHGIEINMINNQNQNQLQFQAQAQVLQTLSGGLVDALQSIRATNQAINIGGTQLASPTNTNTNVRA